MKIEGRVLPDTIELKYKDAGGLHVVTKRDLAQGSSLAKEKPYAVALAPRAADSHCRCCATHLTPHQQAKPITCPRCTHHALYCCKRCLSDDEGPHGASGECFLLQDPDMCAQLGENLREVCLALRLLQKGPCEPPLLTNTALLLGGASGQACAEAAWCEGAVGHMVQAAQLAVDAEVDGARTLDTSDAVDALCQVITNALEIQPPVPTSSTPPGHAVGLYRLASRFNHSCRPTCAFQFSEGAAVKIRSLTHIPQGGELTLTYVDLLLPTSRRRAILRERYMFDCMCDRCAETEAGKQRDWFLSAVRPVEGSNLTAAQLEDMGKGVVREGSRVLEGCNDLEGAARSLEGGLAHVVALGLHPFHHRCLDIYICLVCVNRLAARLECSTMAAHAAAQYAILLGAAAESLLASGESAGLQAAARYWADAGLTLCFCLARYLRSLSGPSVNAETLSPDPDPERPLGGDPPEASPSRVCPNLGDEGSERPKKRARLATSVGGASDQAGQGNEKEMSSRRCDNGGQGKEKEVSVQAYDQGADGKEKKISNSGEATVSRFVSMIREGRAWPRPDCALHGGWGETGTMGVKLAGQGEAEGGSWSGNVDGNSARNSRDKAHEGCFLGTSRRRLGHGDIPPAPLGFGAAVAAAWMVLPQDSLPTALARIANLIAPGENRRPAAFPAVREGVEGDSARLSAGADARSSRAGGDSAHERGPGDDERGEEAEEQMGRLAEQEIRESVGDPQMERCTRDTGKKISGLETEGHCEQGGGSESLEGGNGVAGGHGEDGGNPTGLAAHVGAHVGAVRAELASLLGQGAAWGAEREEESAESVERGGGPETQERKGCGGGLEKALDLAMGATACLAIADRRLQVVHGATHPLTETNAFAAFQNLPYGLAAAMTRAVHDLGSRDLRVSAVDIHGAITP